MKRLFFSPSGAGMVVLLIVFALFAFVTISATAKAEQPIEQSVLPREHASQSAVVEAHIKRFLEKWYKPGSGTRWNQAPEMAVWIVAEAVSADVDPFVLTTLIQYESSFRVRPGKGLECALPVSHGERGLGQLHGLAARHAREQGCDLETPRGQLCGAAHWWRVALERCGRDELKAFRAYQTGDCRIVTAGAERRYSTLRRIRELAAELATHAEVATSEP